MKRIIFILFFLTNILWAQTNSKRCLVLNIKSQIDARTSRYVELGLKKANVDKVDCILIDMNTYGGTVADADIIVSNLLETEIPIYVFIDKNAGSAGSYIAIACDSIYFTEGAVMGASTVVTQDMTVLPEKIQSYQRTKMRSVAETKGRDPKIAEEIVGVNLQTDTAFVRVLTFSEALELGYSEGTYDSKEELLEHLNAPDYTVFELSNIDQLIDYFLNPAVKSILIIMIFGGIYLELKTPGIGLPIGVSLVGVIGYFVPDYIHGLLANWEILLFVIGLVLLILEVFVIPGFGVTGVLGVIFIFSSLFLSMIGNDVFDFDYVNSSNMNAAFQTVGVGFLLAIVLLVMTASLIYKSKRFKKITVQSAIENKINEEVEQFIGQKGKCVTDLRPSGKVRIEGQVLDAMSSGEFIEKDTAVEVIGHSNAQVVVREILS